MSAVLVLDMPFKGQAKERPRVSMFRGQARGYTPQRTRAFERLVGLVATAQTVAQGWAPLEVPCGVRVHFTGKALRGDIDNLVKSVLDALNGIAWKDDALVCELESKRPVATKYMTAPQRAEARKAPNAGRIRVLVWALNLTEPTEKA